VKALKQMKREHNPDHLFVEPSGIVIPDELRLQVKVAGRDVRLSVGPVVLLADALDPCGAFAEEVAHITAQQARQADLLVINKVDSALPGDVDWLEGSLRELSPEAPLYRVSVQSGDGLAGLVAAVLSPSEGR
jgi:G3E family GTPase